MGIEDHTIYLINELGQYEILNEDLSGLEDADEIKEVPTELDAIVHNIQLLCEDQLLDVQSIFTIKYPNEIEDYKKIGERGN